MVLTSAGMRDPAELRTRSRRGYPPLFLRKREGFREHAVALSLFMGEICGQELARSQSTNLKEIGYGQQ